MLTKRTEVAFVAPGFKNSRGPAAKSQAKWKRADLHNYKKIYKKETVQNGAKLQHMKKILRLKEVCNWVAGYTPVYDKPGQTLLMPLPG